MRCARCGAVHPAGFTFCLDCGERMLGHRLWPRSPELLRRAELGRGCPACEAPLTEAISLLVGERAAPDVAQADEVVIRGPSPGSPGLEPTHECRQCGRQFWLVRSWWDGWRLRVVWRTVSLWRGFTQGRDGG